MKVLHICSSLAKAAGGPARSVQGLVSGLQASGVDAWLMAMKPLGDPWVPGIEHYINAGRRNWLGMQRSVENAIDEIRPDLVHVHSIWQWTLHLAVAAARRKRVPYVIAPRGTLEKWSLQQKWLKKKIALLTYQGRDLKHAAAIHVTAQSELEQCQALGLKTFIFSPNGVNVPESLPQWNRKSDGRRSALFLSRMHEKKGVLELLDSWARVRPAGWKLELVYSTLGDAEKKYESRVMNRIVELGLGADVVMIGALSDEEKWNAYRSADLFVLPSFSENFGIVVAEALYAGLPVITTKGTPWHELEEFNCGFWVDVADGTGDWRSMDSALNAAVEMSEEDREVLGNNGRCLIESRYSWSAIASEMKRSYEDILGL